MAQRKILVVEDDPSVMAAYVRTFQKRQVIVLTASDTATAMTLFRENSDISGVVLDGEVPGPMSTAELASEFRKSSKCRLVAVVGDLVKSHSLVKLCDASCQKPFYAADICLLLGLS